MKIIRFIYHVSKTLAFIIISAIAFAWGYRKGPAQKNEEESIFKQKHNQN